MAVAGPGAVFAPRLLRGNKKVNFHDIAAHPSTTSTSTTTKTASHFHIFLSIFSPLLLRLNVYKDLSLCMTMFGSRHTIHCCLEPRGGKGNNVVEVADIPAAGICTAQRKKPHNCNAGNGHLDTLTFPSEGSGHLSLRGHLVRNDCTIVTQAQYFSPAISII